MFVLLLILPWLPGMNLDNDCRVFGNISCHGIQQEDFFEELFRNENELARGEVTVIEILDSNYTVIESFIDPRRFFSRVNVFHLKISNSSIERIAKHAFQELNNLLILDLSHNRIKKMSFVGSIGIQERLDLSHNKISDLDLNVVKSSEYFGKLNFSDNKIVKILPRNDSTSFISLDVSHNRLLEFNETLLNIAVMSIDLRNNFIRNVSIKNRYYHRIINLEGNIITSLSSDDSSTFKCAQLYLTNIPAFLPLGMNVNIFSVRNHHIGILNETAFDIERLKRTDIIDFSHSSIRNISENYFSNIEVSLLNLSFNHISVLEKSLFKSSVIKKLDLSYSGIRIFSNKVFKDISRLEVLNLTGNHIENIEDICKFVHISDIDLSFNMIYGIGQESFGKCEFLHILNISNSQIRIIEEGAFLNLKYLNILDLSNNRLKTIDVNKFGNLKHISVIDLSGNDLSVLVTNAFSNCTVNDLRFFEANIRIIKNKAFNNLINLKILNLSYTGITELEKHAFVNLPALSTLDLSNNNLTVIKSHTFSNLPTCFLLLNGNRIKTMEPFAFTALKNLDIIDLSDNNINEIKEKVFMDLYVGHIDLTKNNITRIASIDNSVILTKLSLQHNGVLEKRTISNNIHLKEIFFVNSSLAMLKKGCFKGLYNLEKLFFNNTVVLAYESGALGGLFHLEHLDARNFFRISNVVRSEALVDLRNMKTLELSHSNLSEIDAGAFVGLQSMEELYLGGNKFQSVRGDIFGDNASLKLLDSFTPIAIEKLFLDNNFIEWIDSKNFHKLTKLRILHLQNNRLKYIPYETFRYLDDLEELRLDGNNLLGLDPGVFGVLNNLHMLNLSRNIQVFENSNLLGLRNLRYLTTLNLEHTSLYLGELSEYNLYREYFPHLKNIYINYNQFSCQELSSVLRYFDEKGIQYPSDYPRYDVRNIDGIVC